MKFKVFLLFVFVELTSGCVSSPKDLVNEIYNKPDSSVFTSESQALKEINKIEHLDNNKVSLEFNKNDSLILINGKRAPVKILELNHDGEKFLAVSSVIKSAGWKKDAFVLPKVSFFMGETLVATPKVKQVGIDGLCGLDACLVTAYDLSSLRKGTYKVVTAAYVENPDAPIEMRKVNGYYYAGSVPLFMTATRAQFASYYGTVKIQISEKLPLNPESKDVQNF